MFMKKIALAGVLLATHCSTFSQQENSAMADEFKEISKFGSRQSGFEGIQTYSSGIVNGSPFFSPEWSSGSVTTVFNETFGKNYLFLFDKVRQELFMKQSDSPSIFLIDTKQINSFTLNTGKSHIFISSSFYDSSGVGSFFEVLVKNDKGYSLLKKIKTKFVPGDPRDIEKQRLGEVYDSFQDDIKYFISLQDGRTQQINLKEKSIIHSLSQQKNKVETYLAVHKEDLIDEEFLKKLIEFINQ